MNDKGNPERQRRGRGPQPYTEAIGKLVEEHADLVRRLARRHIRATGPVVDLQDLISVGVIGLIEAHNLYDADSGRGFGIYAEYRTRGAILDELRRLDPMSQPMRRKAKAYDRATRELQQELGREPNEAELARHLGISLEELQKMRDQAELSPVYLDASPSAELASQPDRFHSARRQLRILLTQAIAKLPDRDQQILNLYYVEDFTMKEIGRLLDLTEARVSQLHKEAAGKLRAILDKDGA